MAAVPLQGHPLVIGAAEGRGGGERLLVLTSWWPISDIAAAGPDQLVASAAEALLLVEIAGPWWSVLTVVENGSERADHRLRSVTG